MFGWIYEYAAVGTGIDRGGVGGGVVDAGEGKVKGGDGSGRMR